MLFFNLFTAFCTFFWRQIFKEFNDVLYQFPHPFCYSTDTCCVNCIITVALLSILISSNMKKWVKYSIVMVEENSCRKRSVASEINSHWPLGRLSESRRGKFGILTGTQWFSFIN